MFGAAISAVFVLLLFLYESFATAIAILVMPLLAVCAVFIGLWVTGIGLNITAMMGMTMIFVHRIGKVLAINPARWAWAPTWVLTDLKPEILVRAGAAQIYGPSLPPRRDLQYPCRLLPWLAELRAGAPSSRPRLAVGC